MSPQLGNQAPSMEITMYEQFVFQLRIYLCIFYMRLLSLLFFSLLVGVSPIRMRCFEWIVFPALLSACFAFALDEHAAQVSSITRSVYIGFPILRDEG